MIVSKSIIIDKLKSIKNNQAEVFNEVAKDYRSIHSENIKISGETSEYFAEYKIIELKNKLKLSAPIKVIDLGCGDGISAIYFNKYFKDIDYQGFDISDESLKIAKARNIERCKFEYYNGITIPVQNNLFDIVYISCVLHHIDFSQHLSLLKECLRVLKPEGKLIIFEHNPLNPITRKLVRDCVFDKDAILIYSHRLKKQIHEIGFKKIRRVYTIFMPRTMFFRPLLFIEKYIGWLPLGGQYYIIAKK